MADVIRMIFQDGKSSIKLLKKDDSRQLVGKSHFAEGQRESRRFAGFVAESIRRADSEQ